MTTIRRKKHNDMRFYAFIDTIMWIYNEIKGIFLGKKKEFVVIQISKEDFSLDRRTLFMFVIRQLRGISSCFAISNNIAHPCRRNKVIFNILRKINCDVFL